jgi:hypothetical protein
MTTFPRKDRNNGAPRINWRCIGPLHFRLSLRLNHTPKVRQLHCAKRGNIIESNIPVLFDLGINELFSNLYTLCMQPSDSSFSSINLKNVFKRQLFIHRKRLKRKIQIESPSSTTLRQKLKQL